MNIQYYRDLTVSDILRIQHHEQNDIDLIFNLRKVTRTKKEDIDFKLALDIFGPILKNKKQVIIVTEHFSIFGFKKSIKFYLYFQDEQFKYKGKAFTIERYISKFGNMSDHYIIEVEYKNQSAFGPSFEVIFNSQTAVVDEFFNNVEEALVMANSHELGFMMAEFADPYPLYITGSIQKLKPRLCSTCVYYNQSSSLDCAVNLTPKKDKMKKGFDCLDYSFDEAKYTPIL
jgi:hypothetical protein